MTAHLKKTSVKLLQFADDTTLIGLIQDGDESAYRQEVKELAVWCSLNNLELNMLKTVEMIVDFWRKGLAQSLSLDPHIQHTRRLTVTIWLTLQSSEHQNGQTQKQFLSPSNPSHEHLTLNVEHTTLLYNY